MTYKFNSMTDLIVPYSKATPAQLQHDADILDISVELFDHPITEIHLQKGPVDTTLTEIVPGTAVRLSGDNQTMFRIKYS